MILICETPFEPIDEIRIFEQKAKASGAIVSFIGKVRREGGADPVTALSLEHYPGMTERSIGEIVTAARRRWNVDDLTVVHRVGRLEPNEPIVLVCVGAAHRREAFEAADFLMDFLKTKALFWKKEIRKSGESWIEPRSADYEDAERWSTPEES